MSRQLNGDEHPTIGKGLFISRTTFGLLTEHVSTTNQGDKIAFMIHLLCSDATRSELEKKDSIVPIENNIKDRMVELTFPWKHELIARPFPKKIVIDSPQQKAIVAQICDNIHLGVGALVSGTPGSGKTQIANIVTIELARRGLKPTIVSGFTPIVKGASLNKILRDIKPSAKQPLILCFNEFDRMVKKVHDGKVANSEHFNICVSDKSELANFLDELGALQHVAFIATTNESLQWFAQEEYRYITRDGRFFLVKELNELTTAETIECFNDGCAKYGIVATVPDFANMPQISLAKLSNAFYRCGGDGAKLCQLLGF